MDIHATLICPKAKRWFWPWHRWDTVLYYPSELSDGEGGAYAGERVGTCRTCGEIASFGIWARGSNTGWAFYRDVRPNEISAVVALRREAVDARG